MPIANPLVGRSTYRSFFNNPAHIKKINDLLFGEGDLTIEEAPLGEIRGRLDLGTDYALTLIGAASYGSPFAVRFQAPASRDRRPRPGYTTTPGTSSRGGQTGSINAPRWSVP